MNKIDTVCNVGAMVEYDNRFDMAKCVPCGKLFEWGNLKAHLLRKHVEEEEEVDGIVAAVRSERELGKDAGALERGSEYISIVKKKVEQKKALKVLEGFEVKECWKCNACGYMAGVMDTMRKHGAGCVGFEMEKIQKTLGQAFMGGKLGGYVEVRKEEDEEVHTLYAKMNQGIIGEEGGQEEVDISCMDAYLAEMRFDVVLKKAELSEEKACEMCEWREEVGKNWVYTVVESYMQKAFKLSMDNPLTRVQELKGERLRLGVSQETVRRYASSVSRLVFFLLAMLEEVGEGFVDEGLLKGIESLEQGRNGRLLHNVLSMLVLDEPEGKLNVVPLFLACVSVIRGEEGKGYRYGVAAEVSPVLAALKYLCQVVVVWEVFIVEGGEKKAGVEKWSRVDLASDARSGSGMNYIHACMKISNRIRGTESGHVRFVRCGKHEMCGFVDGVELSISTLGRAMKGDQKELGSLLEGLLCGLVLDQEFWDGLISLKDNLRNRSVGHWFGANPANEKFCEKWQKLYLQAARGRLFDGTVVKEAEGNRFLEDCQEIQKKLFVLLQVCSGGPARGSEAAVIQVRNKKEASRHLFIQNGQLFFIISYHKGRSMQEGVGKVIARFPDAVTSGFALVYLLVVRPLEALLVGEIAAESGNNEEHRDYLFVRKGVRQEQRTLTSWFSKGMKSAGISYGMNQYRQYYGGAIKNFFSASEEMEDQAIPLHMHGQAGHTEGTAHRIYGVSENDMRSVTALQLEGYRESSRKWVRKLGLSVGVAIGLGHVDEETGVTEGRIDADMVTERGAVEEADIVGHVGTESLAEKVSDMARVLSRVEGMLKVLMLRTEGLSNCSAEGVRRGVKRKLPSKWSPDEEGRGLEGITDILSSPTVLSGDTLLSLREFVGNDTATFRSLEQEEGVGMALQGNQDALIVLPTGGGKSLTFMLPAFMGQGAVCVVIVPLVALQEDIVRRCSERGVQAVRWADRNVAGNRVVVVSAENVASVEYRVFMAGLYNNNKLHAIFIDEGHLVVTSKAYRPPMKYIEENVRPQGVECAMYVLTATAPQALEESIAKACGLKNWCVVRGLTSRRNMKYSVKDVFWKSLKLEVLDALKGLNKVTEGNARYIVYGQLREFCEEMQGIIKMVLPDVTAFFYHGGVEDTERRRTEKEWAAQDGGKKVMVATNAFGCGLDIGNVRAVIHAGVPSCLIDFIQESGRGGRDGEMCISLVLNVKDARIKPVEDGYGRTDKLIETSGECRRISIDAFADGVTHTSSCVERGMEACDVCEKAPHDFVVEEEGSSKIPGEGEKGADTPGTKRSVKRRKYSIGHADKAVVRQINKDETKEEEKKGNEEMVSSVRRTASAEELQEIADKLKGACAVCSVMAGKEVRHRSRGSCANMQGRCLACCGKGHKVSDCPLRSRKGIKGCYRCGISEYAGVRVHSADTYGKRGCPYQVLVGVCVTSWDHVTTKRRIIEEFGVPGSTTGVEFLNWVVGNADMEGMEGKSGVGVLIGWLFTNTLQGGN